MRFQPSTLLLLLLTAWQTAPAHGDEIRHTAPERAWSDNLRWSLDASTQQRLNLDSDQWLDQYVIGLDLHKVVSNDRRDIGTLILQPYVVWLPEDRARPPFFDGKEATLTWRIANFNLRVLPRGRLNVRLGHFEYPFGLEHDINTNGTLRQYSNGVNLGGKADWGISANGLLSGWQYEVALTRGSGQEYHRRNDPYVFSARIGTPTERNLAVGVSAFQGDVLTPSGLVERDRYGADLRWSAGPLQLLAEVSTGTDFDDRVRNRLAELNWTNSFESLLAYAQHRRHTVSAAAGRRGMETNGIGIRWLINNKFTLAAQYDRRNGLGGNPINDSQISVHFRFRTGESP